MHGRAIKKVWGEVWLITALIASPIHADQYRIDENGVDGLVNPILFSEQALASRFPDLDVTFEHRPNPFGAEPAVLMLSDSVGPVYFADVGLDEIYTFSIFTQDPRVIGPNGWRIGETQAGTVVSNPNWECGRGFEELLNSVVCLQWESGLRAVFAFGPNGLQTVRAGSYHPDMDGALLVELRQFLSRPVQ